MNLKNMLNLGKSLAARVVGLIFKPQSCHLEDLKSVKQHVGSEKLFTTNQFWGIVEEVGQGYVTIYRHEWAPGLWAGVYNLRMCVNRSLDITDTIIVHNVDLETRRVYYTHFLNRRLNLGDALYPIWSKDE